MIWLFARLFVLFPFLWGAGFVVFIGYVDMILKPYEGRSEGIVVLTGGGGRVETGLALLQAKKARHLLISGVHKDVREEGLLKMYHADPKLAPKITLGFKAYNTAGNAEETSAWVSEKNIHSLIVVTAHYHMPRAMVHLGTQLPEITLYPYPVRPDLFKGNWMENKEAWKLLWSDYNKFLLTYPQIYFFYS
jgi:uncharacterized SAM-binding protein YcdF (DUF218 family)